MSFSNMPILSIYIKVRHVPVSGSYTIVRNVSENRQCVIPCTTPHAAYNFVQRHVAHFHTPFLFSMRTLEKALLLLVFSPLYLLSASCVTWGELGHNTMSTRGHNTIFDSSRALPGIGESVVFNILPWRKKIETATHAKVQARACSRDHAPVPQGAR